MASSWLRIAFAMPAVFEGLSALTAATAPMAPRRMRAVFFAIVDMLVFFLSLISCLFGLMNISTRIEIQT